MRLELLAARHRSLAVTTCEWRAFGLADPEQMADAVFDHLLGNPDPNLVDFYRAVDEVVHLTYLRQAAKANILEHLTNNLSMPGRRTPTDEMLQVLSQLRGKHRTLLQLRYWDDLSATEAAEALQLGLQELTERQAKAEDGFRKRVVKRHPELAKTAVGDLVARAKPGKHTRQLS